MRVRLLVVGLVVSVATGLSAAPALACASEACAAVNAVCNKVSKGSWDCVA